MPNDAPVSSRPHRRGAYLLGLVQVYLAALLRVEGLYLLGDDKPLLAVNQVLEYTIDEVENYRTNNYSLHSFRFLSFFNVPFASLTHKREKVTRFLKKINF